jgi:tRNA pseudouridine38-40 synthase
MSRFRATISYDGSNYVGWQVQPNGRTVQQAIQDVLLHLTQTAIIVHGSGRTDQGVHGRAQVIHFDLESLWSPTSLRHALNALLASDIRVTSLQKTRPDFHARRSAISKEYRYFIWNGEIMPPQMRLYRTHIRQHLDVDLMSAAAQHLVGCHDFAAFRASSRGSVDSTVRTISAVTVTRRGREITLRVSGDGFLYKMVRSIAGHLICVGQGAETPESTIEILSSGTRTARVPTARPEGLFLWKVDY